MAVRTSIIGYGPRPTDSLWRPFAARTVLKKIENWLLLRCFLRQNQLERWLCLVVVALLNLSLKEMKKKKFQNLGLGSGLFLAQTELFLAQTELFLTHNNYKSRPTDSLFWARFAWFGPYPIMLVRTAQWQPCQFSMLCFQPNFQ